MQFNNLNIEDKGNIIIIDGNDIINIRDEGNINYTFEGVSYHLKKFEHMEKLIEYKKFDSDIIESCLVTCIIKNYQSIFIDIDNKYNNINIDYFKFLHISILYNRIDIIKYLFELGYTLKNNIKLIDDNLLVIEYETLILLSNDGNFDIFLKNSYKTLLNSKDNRIIQFVKERF